RGTGVQLNAPASHIIAESDETDAAHRTGVQLNAPALQIIDHTSQLDVATDKNIDAGAFHRTGVRLNAPAPHFIAESGETDAPHRTGVQLNAPAPDRNDLQRNNDIDAVHGHLPARHPNNRYSMISPRRDTLAVVVRTYKAAVTTLCRRSGYAD